MLPRVVILCGGRGTRLTGQNGAIPKPLVEIGGRPILWHVIQIYLAQGFTRFLLLTGYKAELIERFVDDERWPPGTEIRCLQTGLDTPTGGRLAAATSAIGGERFCATYADGVADIDLRALLEAHDSWGAQATMTVVRPVLQFGIAELNGEGVVRGFVEKPRSEHWVNGGFFCFEPSVLELIEPNHVLERQTLGRLAEAGELRAFRHERFWDCMDTYKDAVLLNDLWADGRAPWKLWA
ncbi:MAG TPA: sugar phosphate nucleotidyltransferase [Solirubrobacteraceae bacterium]|jgi:glucose-1-phosphate cytidylyltransferase